jgi:hypothetical protein
MYSKKMKAYETHHNIKLPNIFHIVTGMLSLYAKCRIEKRSVVDDSHLNVQVMPLALFDRI